MLPGGQGLKVSLRVVAGFSLRGSLWGGAVSRARRGTEAATYRSARGEGQRPRAEQPVRKAARHSIPSQLYEKYPGFSVSMGPMTCLYFGYAMKSGLEGPRTGTFRTVCEARDYA